MKYLVFSLVALIVFTNCKRKDCGCVPPPFSESNWKITRIEGGIAGTTITLTEEQDNTRLTIKEGGHYTATNFQTGAVANGTFTMTNFNSIYGERQRLIFSPKLSILNYDYLILVDNPNGKMILGDNLADGYQVTLTAQH